MNAKKIMGAVLVALLAAALFVGAGAAAETNSADGKTVFIFQNLTAAAPAGVTLSDFEGTWYNGDKFVTIEDGIVKPSANFAPGTYKNGVNSIYVNVPTASYSAGGNVGDVAYIVNNGGKVYMADGAGFTLTATTAAGITVSKYQITLPNGKVELVNSINTIPEKSGTYKVQAVFNKEFFMIGVDSDYLLDTANSFTYTGVGTEDATLAVNVDTAYSGEFVTITLEGTIGEEYTLLLDGFEFDTDQFVGDGEIEEVTPDKKYTITMPNTGKVTLQAMVKTADDEAKVTLDLQTKKDIEIKIKVSAPVVTATVGAATYFVGDVIKISGTTTADTANFEFTISGTNFKETDLTDAIVEGDDTDLSGKDWKVAIATAGITEENNNGKKLDVGTYTIKIYQGDKVVKTVAVALKQPFISIAEAPEVVAQKTDAEFIINAEAADDIAAYIFGTNYFAFPDKIEQDDDVKTKFTITIDEDTTYNMSTGQYFMVFQHPMYDKAFNIMATEAGAFYLNTSGNAVDEDGVAVTGAQYLFAFDNRQTANAAQALCDALDSQNIDDMYVKYSFFVVGKDAAFTISEIPTQITKGTTLTISGVDTANADAPVVVEMISTAFAAVPKDTVGSAAFVVVTTEVAEDGTWEVTLDTSDLNVDEYALTVKIAEDVKKNVNINVVEAAPDVPDTPDTPDVPDTPDTPDTPTEPETPGFGALAALAGLGAVAVLLLRRE